MLFSGTVRENICYARPEASDDEVREAAVLANAHECVYGWSLCSCTRFRFGFGKASDALSLTHTYIHMHIALSCDSRSNTTRRSGSGRSC